MVIWQSYPQFTYRLGGIISLASSGSNSTSFYLTCKCINVTQDPSGIIRKAVCRTAGGLRNVLQMYE